MAAIVLRSVVNRPLTIAEADANINNLNTELGQKLDTSTYTATDVLTKIKTVDGAGSGLDADMVDGLHVENIDTSGSSIVSRVGGNFSANIITAGLIGNVTGNLIGNVTGNVSGNATNVNGIVATANGGTGSTSLTGAGIVTTADVQTIGGAKTFTGGATINALTLGTALAVSSGGTGAITASTARTNLGLTIGLDVQAYSGQLASLSGLATNGLVYKNDAVIGSRTISGGTSISVSSPVATDATGAFVIDLVSNPSLTSITKTGTNGTGDIGSSTNKFGTIYGTATSAKYADLAEKYTTDKEYPAGTVMVVSNDDHGEEATASWLSGQRVLGVVSTNPAHVMNDDIDGQAIGLVGRLPVKVIGPVRKGQTLICNQEGKAIVGDSGHIFGQALETNLDPGVKLVECVIK